jgi:2-polyprenyl-3-methyl-5-hydroxy-6-metoxy-1,4-benzoquinol methylase
VTPRLLDASLIESVYDESYWNSSEAKVHGYSDYRADAPLYKRTYRDRLTILRRYFPSNKREDGTPRRVLDIGCAAGYFLSVMQEEGWQVTGLEPSDAIRVQAEKELGAKNVCGGLLGVDDDLAPGSFDLVTFWDVIEHIPDPRAALVRARKLLAPGGLLIVETQNVNSRAAKVLGKKWQHYKHAEHIYHFNKATLTRLLDEAGFGSLENSARHGGKFVTFSFVAERVGRIHPFLSVLASPLRLLGNMALYINLFDEMIVVAEPKP